MYNHIELESFIDKVTKEADEAAQAIFDKYTPELERRIKAQMKKGHTIVFGMGTAAISPSRDLPYNYAEKFLHVLTSTQYPILKANFSPNDIYK